MVASITASKARHVGRELSAEDVLGKPFWLVKIGLIIGPLGPEGTYLEGIMPSQKAPAKAIAFWTALPDMSGLMLSAKRFGVEYGRFPYVSHGTLVYTTLKRAGAFHTLE